MRNPKLGHILVVLRATLRQPGANSFAQETCNNCRGPTLTVVCGKALNGKTPKQTKQIVAEQAPAPSGLGSLARYNNLRRSVRSVTLAASTGIL